jgi:hypothetical protein
MTVAKTELRIVFIILKVRCVYWFYDAMTAHPNLMANQYIFTIILLSAKTFSLNFSDHVIHAVEPNSCLRAVINCV